LKLNVPVPAEIKTTPLRFSN